MIDIDDWIPDPRLEDHQPCERFSACHFDRFVPVVRTLMHSFFYDPETAEGQKRREEQKAQEERIAGHIGDLFTDEQPDPATAARALWAVVVLAAQKFEQRCKEGSAKKIGEQR